MDLHTALLLVLACAFFVTTLCLGWLLLRPRISIEVPGRATLPAQPRPTHVKCNAKHFIFTRTNPESGELEQADVWRHPYCEGLPNDMLTDAVQGANFLDGRQGQGWQHAETRGEMHMVKL